MHQTKNNEKRYIPMNRIVKSVFESIPARSNSLYVFSGKDGMPFDFRKAFETAMEKAKIQNFRFHDLRHTFASYLRMAGVDMHTISELLGHKSLHMTKRYAHLSHDYKTRAVQVLELKTVPALSPQPIFSETEYFEEIVSDLESTG